MTCLCAKVDVDPRSGQRAVLRMRLLFLVPSLAVLAACGGGTAVSTSRPAPSADGAAAAVDAVITGAPRLTPEWGLAGRAKATTGARAIRLAEGHMLDAVRSRDLEADADRLRMFPASARQFLVDGHAPPAGTMFRQPDLARTLRLIADSGPDVFYRGQIADSIVAEMQRGHGLITKNDPPGYPAKWRTPVQVTYRGYTVYSTPPASSGGGTIADAPHIPVGS